MSESGVRQRFLLDGGWRFHRGDVAAPLPNTHIAAYMVTKAGYARGAARPGFDDSDWPEVDLPHDWAIDGPFDPDNHIDAGYLPRGVGWYRRRFKLDSAHAGRSISIRFEGVASHCTVFINGHLLHRHFDGYTSFDIDISEIANVGDAINTIAVRVDATPVEGWWYEGAGIYRHVWLTVADPVHVPPDGVFVRTERLDQEHWRVNADVEVRNDRFESTNVFVRSTILDAGGNEIGRVESTVGVPARTTSTCSQSIDLNSPAVWSIESPSLHTLRVEIIENGRVIDRTETRFGFRTIRFDADRGFFLNDKPVKLLGTCNHQDHAGVGVAVSDSVQRFRIRRLKEMGSNAYRCAHHPPSPALLDACDELGMLVMDENRFFGTSPEHFAQLDAMVRRDRNHPSVILWSICNEEAIQSTPTAGRIARAMVARVKQIDPTRPVTAAVSGGVLLDGTIGDALDVMSINYQLPLHDEYHKLKPNCPLIAAETHCVFATRGERSRDEARHRFADGDGDVAKWGASAAETWAFVSRRDFIAGLFIWTGFDYRGEPTPHEWPSVQSHWGVLDLCGFPKRAFYEHQKWWGAHFDPLANLPPVGSGSEAIAWGVAIDATSFRDPIVADGEHVVLLTVFAVDERGERVAGAMNTFSATVHGPAAIIGSGNGDPTSRESNRSSTRSLFYGLAQLIVKCSRTPGELVIAIHGEGLRPAELRLDVKPGVARPSLPSVPQRFVVGNWRVSPVLADRHAALVEPSNQDMNTWQTIDPKAFSPVSVSNGVIAFRATARVPVRVQRLGGMLRLHGVHGPGEVLVNGVSRSTWRNTTTNLDLPIEKGTESISILVIFAGEGCPCGLTGEVEIIPV